MTSDEEKISKKFFESKTNLEKYLVILDRIKENTTQLQKLEEEIEHLKQQDNKEEDKIKEIELNVKEIETINKHIKDYLDKSLVWMIGIVSFIISVLIALLSVAVTIVLGHLKNIK